MSIDSKQLRNLSRIYQEAVYGGGKKETPKDTRMVVTAADKKANTKAYQNYKAGNKAYKAADHMKEQKKAAKDYDGDGKVESGKEEYFGSRDKAIKKAMGKKVKESFSNWRHDLKEIPNYEQIPVSGKARNEKITEKNVKNSIKINPEMKEEYGKKKKKKGHHCASKVKHEEFGIGDCISEAHDLDENGNVAHYDVEFEKYIVKNVPVGELEILEGEMHEHVIHEKHSADTKGKKNCGCGQDPCVTYGKQEDVKEGVYEKQKTKEVMGALKKRDLKKDVKKKIAADIVKRKGDTSKSDDRYAYESKLWDEVAENLTQLGELNDVEFKVEGYQRDPEQSKKDRTHSKQPDPSKDGFTGIGNMSIKDIMKMNAKMKKAAKK